MYEGINFLSMESYVQVQLQLERTEQVNNKILRDAARRNIIHDDRSAHDRITALDKALKDQNTSVEALAKQYKEDVEKAKTDGNAQKRLDQTTKDLAKALPGMTKGTLNAIKAFQKGDAIGGSAAVMDIFASLSPFLGGLAAGGGPPGMLVGAVFSMVGEILRFFGPKPKSLSEKINSALQKLQAEDAEMNILAFRDNVTIQVNSLK
jgi:hypothetical protein